MTCQGQTNKFDNVVNALQFHVFTDSPDSCVLPFLKRCAPVLASKPKSVGGWSMYPPGPAPIPQQGLLSIKVAHHPALHCVHSGARFDILTQEWQDGTPGISALRVWFYFNRKADADKAFKTLVEMFKAANTTVKMITEKDVQVAMLNDDTEDWVSAKLILQRGRERDPKYNILFTNGFDNGASW